MNTLLIRDVRIVDSYAGTDRTGTILHDGDGAAIGPGDLPDRQLEPAETIDGSRLIALPGLTDLYARLGEPGNSRKGTIASESRAALAAGITTVLCSPDTDPVIDSATTVQWIHERVLASRGARVLPMAAMTAGLDGQQLAELATLQAVGCVAASQGDRQIASSLVLQRAMEYAATFDMPLILTPMDADLSGGGCAHAGSVATRLGLPGIPVTAETVEMTRLLELAGSIGCRLHLARLSSARAVELMQRAHDDGLAITASVGIHHLFYTHHQLAGYNVDFHSAVPFRTVADREALRQGVKDGVISTICSDHSPHEPDARLAPFPASAAGLSAYDSFLALLFALPELLDMPLLRLLERVTSGPQQVIARNIDTPAPVSRPGHWSDLVLVDPDGFTRLEDDTVLSSGRNNPLWGLHDLDECTGEAITLRAAVNRVFIEGQLLLDNT